MCFPQLEAARRGRCGDSSDGCYMHAIPGFSTASLPNHFEMTTSAGRSTRFGDGPALCSTDTTCVGRRLGSRRTDEIAW